MAANRAILETEAGRVRPAFFADKIQLNPGKTENSCGADPLDVVKYYGTKFYRKEGIKQWENFLT